MILRLKIFVYNLFVIKLKWWLMMNFNNLVRSQIKNPKTIPIIIINFNQLFYLRQLVDFLQRRKFENIIIVDNLSTYSPLLEYYKTLKGVTVEYMDQNYGHKVFYENKSLQKKYGQGFYVVTDADINFYPDMPSDFMDVLLSLLNKHRQIVTKVGFALNIDDIPDQYKLKNKVLNWEKVFWENEIEKNVYMVAIDTTFALYLPGFPKKNNKNTFYRALRIGGAYRVKHGGWYQDSDNLTAEQEFYLNSANSSSSWKTDAAGNVDSEFTNLY